MNKEPSMISAGIAALIVGLLARYNVTWIDSTTVEAALQVIAVLVMGYVTRSQVFSKATLVKANLSPAEVEAKAKLADEVTEIDHSGLR